MGTTTTNLGLYKPAVGETGWGSLVDANFDTVDTRLHPLNAAVMFAHPSGSNANDGLSWATAKKDVLGAYDALPSDGGEIRYADSTYVDASNTTNGLWLAGSSDPQYASLPSGWRQIKKLKLVGYGGRQAASSSHAPAAMLLGGHGTDRSKPIIWIAGSGTSIAFENVHMQYPAVAVRLGMDSNTQAPGQSVAGVWFKNCSTNLNSVAGNGPGIELGYVFWLFFEDCAFGACAASYAVTAASITSGTTARFTVGTHYLKAGDTVRVYGMTPSGYNGTWTVSAIAATTFDADIGTSPAAGSVFGSAQPIRSYRRAAIGFDGVDVFPSAAQNPGLIFLRNTNFNSGHFHYAPMNGYGGNIGIENGTYEGDFVSTQPPYLHVRGAYGAADLPSGLIRISVKHVEMADGVFPDGAVRVDGEQTSHDIVTIQDADCYSTAATVIGGTGVSRRAVGYRGRLNPTTKYQFDLGILGSHDAARRQGGGVAVRFTNRADQNTANWSGKSGTATVATGITDPHGGTNAATITRSGGNASKEMSRFTVTPSVGDWVIAGVWRRWVSMGTESDLNYPSISVTGTAALDNTLGSHDKAMRGPNGFSDGGWEWLATASKIVSVAGGTHDIILQINSRDGETVAYYAPVLFHVPVASVVDDDEMYDIARHLQPYSNNATVGDISFGVASSSAQFIAIDGIRIGKGTGSPESVVTAPIGSLFLRTDGGATTTLYVKTSGTGNTGWTAK